MSMHPCPHCSKPGISTVQKLGSVCFGPAVCALCSRRSAMPYVHGIRAMIFWVVVTWVFIGIAMFERMPIYLVGTIPAMLIAIDKYMLSAPMHSID
ncbi:MAG: hypothetical protein RLZZ227_2253 [Pseudomonadota bacterium]|jgi:hypothetical protein